MASSTPMILYLLLGDEKQSIIFKYLYHNIRTQIDFLALTIRARTAAEAQSLLSTRSFKAVLAVDSGIAVRRNDALQRQLASYARLGGTVIFCCLLTIGAKLRDMNKLWENFEQPWKIGEYHRTTCSLSQKLTSVLGHKYASGLEQEYSAVALRLKNVPLDSRAYTALGRPMVEPRDLASRSTDNSQTSAAFHKYGDGWLGYIGDMKNETGSQSLLMALLRRSSSGLAR
ncbi:MAG: hypothetical protein Q9216_003444 [Gyalolechia sp. 2 TL-2023]